ncbi:hypothetical protein AN958_06098 [Leucoagaricus sp. SymC.cos]|nr:hypothetical protein AN958_06098 [Leucoagaricus sp. SymC.cos]
MASEVDEQNGYHVPNCTVIIGKVWFVISSSVLASSLSLKGSQVNLFDPEA